jgi:lipopolysaccharide transport system ATP-binding protein
MYMRLAFAVAAHLEPEILIVDEVLAVGDAEFQKKCLGKMGALARGGRTVLFVSHNIAAVNRLCPRAVRLESGRLADDGPALQVTASYLQSGSGMSAARRWDPAAAPGNQIVKLASARVKDEAGETCDSFDVRCPVGLEVEFTVVKPGFVLVPTFGVYNQDGLLLFITHDTDLVWRRRPRDPGRYTSTAWIPGDILSEGLINVDVAISRHAPVEPIGYQQSAISFQMVDNMDGNGARGDYAGPLPGAFRPLLRWTTAFETPGT